MPDHWSLESYRLFPSKQCVFDMHDTGFSFIDLKIILSTSEVLSSFLNMNLCGFMYNCLFTCQCIYLYVPFCGVNVSQVSGLFLEIEMIQVK